MTNKITKIENQIAEQFKLEITDAEKIVGAFKDIATSINEIDQDLKEFGKPEVITKDVCKKAYDLRWRYVKIRTAGDDIHKQLKADLLLRTKAIDGVRNIYKLKASEREAQLKEIETHFEKIEAEKKEKLIQERLLKLSEYSENDQYTDREIIESMEDNVFEQYLNNVKIAYKVRKEAEEKAEKERIKAEKQKAIEEKRIREENERLKKEIEEKRIADEEAEKERQRLAKIEADKLAKIEKERQAELQKEREARKKIEDELKAKQEQEIKDKKEAEEKALQIELEKLKAEKEARLAPDKDKMRTLYAEIREFVKSVGLNYNFAEEEYKDVKGDVVSKLNESLLLIENKSKNL